MNNKKISFIVIGKNVEKTLKGSIESIYDAIEYCEILDFEILYIDSKSADDSVLIAKEFQNIRIFQITGKTNAAVGRNIGAIESKGDILCFLDGDMYLEPAFISKVIIDGELIYPFISGQLKNVFYNEEWQVVGENLLFPKLANDKYFTTTGGYFIITKDLWQNVGGMNTKYKRGEDIDLGLRLSKIGVKLLRKKDLFVNHHTIHYQDKSRFWKMLFDGSLHYGTSVLYRDHFFNKHIYPRILRNSYTLILLICCASCTFLSGWCLLPYFTMQFIRAFYQDRKFRVTVLFEKFIYFTLTDVLSVIGFLIFHPQKKIIHYKSA